MGILIADASPYNEVPYRRDDSYDGGLGYHQDFLRGAAGNFVIDHGSTTADDHTNNRVAG